MTLHVSHSSKRVLIAEDDDVTRRLLSAVVKSEGYDAVAVNDGREAYRILQSDGKFEAAIFDMKMPHPGVTVFLPKPFTADQLQTVVRMLLNRKRISPASPPQVASLGIKRLRISRSS